MEGWTLENVIEEELNFDEESARNILIEDLEMKKMFANVISSNRFIWMFLTGDYATTQNQNFIARNGEQKAENIAYIAYLIFRSLEYCLLKIHWIRAKPTLLLERNDKAP